MFSPSYCAVRLFSGRVCVKMAGIESPSTASSSMLDVMFIESLLKVCFLYLRPPANIDMPSTSSMLPMTEPASDAFTTSNMPAFMATKAIISSVALPKVAFSRPPIFCPQKREMSSVLFPMTPASGIMASELQRKSMGSENPMNLPAMVTGMKISSI